MRSTTIVLPLVLLACMACAAPRKVKDAASEQLTLLTQMQAAVGALEVHLGEHISADKSQAAFNRQQAALAEQAADATTSPKARLQNVKESTRLTELNALVQDLAQERVQETARAQSEDPGQQLQDIVFVGNDVRSLTLLGLQLKTIRSAQVIVERYLATDVFGDEQVRKATTLATEIRGMSQ